MIGKMKCSGNSGWSTKDNYLWLYINEKNDNDDSIHN